MQSFAEFMAESFHSNVPLTWDLSDLSRATASFTVDSVKVVVSFERRTNDGPWHIVFEVDRGERTAIAHSAFAIFNGVLQATEEFLTVRQPDVVVFATKRDDLSGIYQTYLRRESEALAKLGYQLEGPIQMDPYAEFVLRRIRRTGWSD
jgi:hypothetical protein